MLRIKLSRVGKKKQPIYRIRVIERQRDPWGKFIENVGTYNPRSEPKALELNEERIKHWISVGAQPTDTVHNLLVGAGIISDKKRNVSKLGKKAKEAAKKDSDGSDGGTDGPDKDKVENVEAQNPASEEKPKENSDKPDGDSDGPDGSAADGSDETKTVETQNPASEEKPDENSDKSDGGADGSDENKPAE